MLPNPPDSPEPLPSVTEAQTRLDADLQRRDDAFERYHQLHGVGADEWLTEISIATDLAAHSRDALEAAKIAHQRADVATYPTFKAWADAVAEEAEVEAKQKKADSDTAHANAPQPPNPPKEPRP